MYSELLVGTYNYRRQFQNDQMALAGISVLENKLTNVKNVPIQPMAAYLSRRQQPIVLVCRELVIFVANKL